MVPHNATILDLNLMKVYADEQAPRMVYFKVIEFNAITHDGAIFLFYSFHTFLSYRAK